ncbi:thiosulfate oxidation carrier protein SoxY [Paracoccus sp. (in: a-proteobacteria)]|uniref:thiosulfate oxidation carrier protein SoxY n=1 Tax=Paracoccus sp. TaxID=267 RepID=UPI0026E09473|nr:thiosulfate oxidation carrier protein SoxY [Paracoccus sp. (in: a-proteobacteria)]MDO5371129.1 thiosulfate oxidation carrier protein SoxY [Paracoccus sp. (in: a-proteobacteria)]
MSDLDRRGLLMGTAALAGMAALGLRPALAQSSLAMPQLDSALAEDLAAEFAGGATPLAEGLALDLPALGDNPAAVPVRVHVTEPITEDSWCEEIIVIAELNPLPLACRFKFTPAMGSADVAVRLRLIGTMPVRALARMNDGRVLVARQEITVAAGGCGL